MFAQKKKVMLHKLLYQFYCRRKKNFFFFAQPKAKPLATHGYSHKSVFLEWFIFPIFLSFWFHLSLHHPLAAAALDVHWFFFYYFFLLFFSCFCHCKFFVMDIFSDVFIFNPDIFTFNFSFFVWLPVVDFLCLFLCLFCRVFVIWGRQ